MQNDKLDRLAKEQEAIMEALAGIKDQLEANEWRRKCLWVQASINRCIDKLKKRFPGYEQTFKEIVEPVDCYANLIFKSPTDLRAVYTCFSMVADILESQEKTEMQTLKEIWQQIHPLLEELNTLETGDPPSLSNDQLRMRSLDPEVQDTERAAVRKRLDQRLQANIKEKFDRQKAEDEEYYR